MVLHTRQANPHVHVSVRVEGRDGKRLNPHKKDLHQWRETFAEKLRDWGIEAEALSQATRSGAMKTWAEITKALAASPDSTDREHSKRIVDFEMQTEAAQAVPRMSVAQRETELPRLSLDRGWIAQQLTPEPIRGPDINR